MSNDTFLTSKQVKDRYQVSDMSLWRWSKNVKLDFPKAIEINRRRLWRLADLERWERARAGKAAA